MAMIRHTRWFEEHANQSSVRILIKVLKDIKRRYEGFKALDVWSLELLVSLDQIPHSYTTGWPKSFRG